MNELLSKSIAHRQSTAKKNSAPNVGRETLPLRPKAEVYKQVSP